MLFTGEDILSGFKKRLEGATRIRIATAWATPGSALDGLEAAVQKKEKKGKKGLKVRAIVGTYGNVTKPSALECLKKLGKLRLAKDASLFHPKVYIFESENGARCAWVGSANFTGRGFGGGNVEIMYETDEVEPFLKWFKQQWRQSERATKEAIDDYRKRRKKDPPSRTLPEVGESAGAAPEPLLPPEAQTWESVLDPEEIRDAFNQMRKTLIEGAEQFRRTVGGEMRTVYWHDDVGYWCAFRDPDIPPQRYWNPFGAENPEEANQLGSGCLQINPGHGQYGLFVRNDRGGIFLARSLTAIRDGQGVVDREDLEEGLDERLPGRVVDMRWGDRTRRMVILSEVGSGELRKTVAELVRLVAELGAAGEAP